MKKIRVTLLLLCGIICGPEVAGAVDIQAAPVVKDKPSSPEIEKQNFNVGPRDSQKEKSPGVWLNFFKTKEMSVGCGVSLLPRESLLPNAQRGNNGVSGLSADKVQGCVGFKYSFR